MTAACVTNPIDVIKIRLQIQGELQKVDKGLGQIYGSNVKYKGFLRGVGTIIADEGIRGLYKGYRTKTPRSCLDR